MPTLTTTRTLDAAKSDLRMSYRGGAITTHQLANAAAYAREDIATDHAIAAILHRAAVEIGGHLANLNSNEGADKYDPAYAAEVMFEALDRNIAPNHQYVIRAALAWEVEAFA